LYHQDTGLSITAARHYQGVEKKASGRQPRHYQLKAQGSKLIGKDPTRSAFSSQM
jgi:hypothetical protein